MQWYHDRPSAAVVWAAMGFVFVAGCSPALDWRTARFEAAPVEATLPCKPERATREVPLRGPQQPPVALHMLSCQAAGRTFAVAAVRLPDAPAAGAAAASTPPMDWIETWQRASWATLRVDAGAAPAPAGWQAVPCALRDAAWSRCWRGSGQAPDGQPVAAELHWASNGRWLVQMALYGPSLPPEAHALFFGGVALR